MRRADAIVLGLVLLGASCGGGSAGPPRSEDSGAEDAGTEPASFDDKPVDAPTEAPDSADDPPADSIAGPFALDDGAPIDDAGLDHELCEMSCAVVSAVPCGDRSPACVETCEDLIATDPCATETRALRVCLIASGGAALVCVTPPGQTILLPGFCQDEVAAGQACRAGDAGR